MYKLLSVILTLCVFLPLSGCSWLPYPAVPSPVPTETVIPAPEELYISTLTIQKEVPEENLLINLEIPVLNGLKNEVVQNIINRTLFDYSEHIQNEIESWARKNYESLPTGMAPSPHILDLWYTIHTFNQATLSLSITYYRYTGGAHGITITQAYTFRLSDGKLYSLPDLFPPGFDYITKINHEIYARNKEFVGEFSGFRYIVDTFDSITPETKFYVENDTLVLFFNPYEIAAFALGYLEFHVSGNIPFQLN